MVPAENAPNLRDCKEIKRNRVTRNRHKIANKINRIDKHQAIFLGLFLVFFFGHVMRREKLDNLEPSVVIEGKRTRGKQQVNGQTKWPNVGRVTDALKAKRGLRCVEGHDHLRPPDGLIEPTYDKINKQRKKLEDHMGETLPKRVKQRS